MLEVKNFNDFITEDRNKDILEKYSVISSVMNKVISYNKREAVAMGNVTNESFRAMYRYNQNIYFSTEERSAINEMFSEFIPRVADAMAKELYESGIEFSDDILGELGINGELNEGFKDWGKKFKDAYNSVVDASKSVANKVGGIIDDTKEYIDDKKSEIKKATDDARKKIVEKYRSIIGFLNKLVSKEIKSVKEFIVNVVKLLEKFGDTLKDSLRRLGAFDVESGEEGANIKIENKFLEGLTEDRGEKSFFEHVIAYMTIMLGDEEKVEKLMEEGFDNLKFDFNEEDELNEGKIMDKVANNKYIQFILCYGKGKKISIWKSILISIVGSLVISLGLPIALAVCGVGAATIPVCVMAARILWSSRGALKIIFNRYVNKNPGEKLFNLKTCVLISICVIPQIPPFKDWIAEGFMRLLKWLGIDKWIENAEELLGKLIEKLHGKNPSLEDLEKSWNETIDGGGGYQMFTNWDENNAELMQKAKECGSSDKALNAISKIINGAKEIKGSTNFHKYWQGVVDKFGEDMPQGMIVDTDKPGVNSLFNKAMRLVAETGDYPGMTSGTIGGEIWHEHTHRIAGSGNLLYNMSDDAKKAVLAKFKELGGKIDDLQIIDFGKDLVHKAVPNVELITKPVHWLFDTLEKSFGVAFDPWLDAKTFDKYKMSFGSNTRKLPYHKVVSVKSMTLGDAKKHISSDNVAFAKFIDEIKYIQNTHEAFIKKAEERLEKTEDKDEKNQIKKFLKEQHKSFESNGNFDKRKVDVFFIEWNDKKTDKVETDVPGIMMDNMSMLCVDICPKRKPRRYPYYIKGLLSRLSFKPIDKNDNETKQFIRTTLGTMVNTDISRLYDFGIAGCVVEFKDDKFQPGDKLEQNKALSYLGNFTQSEICEILNDKEEEHPVGYSYLSGKYGSRVSRGSKDSKTISLKSDKDTIENRRYLSGDTPIKDDKTVTVRNKEGKRVKMKYSEMAKYKADKYNFRRATPEEIESGEKTMDYVEARIIPLINDKDTKLHKELYGDEDIKKLFFDGDKVDKGMMLSIKDFLYRSETSFSKKDEYNACEKINAYRKEHKMDEIGKESYDTIKKTVETIWELKGKYSNSAKPKKEKTDNNDKKDDKKDAKKTNENLFMSFDDFVNLND